MFIQEIKQYALKNYHVLEFEYIYDVMSDREIYEVVKDCISFSEAQDVIIDYASKRI